MTPRQFFHSVPEAEFDRVALAAGTKPINLKHIALWGGACSAELARRLSEASDGQMSLEDILFRKERDAESNPAA